jgi:hypothetical protein
VQVGEPVSVAPPSSPPDDVEFEEKLASVTFKSTLKTSHAKCSSAFFSVIEPDHELGYFDV